MIRQTHSKSRHEDRSLLRFFVKLHSIEEQETEVKDALIADSSEDGVGLFTESLLPIGTKVEVIVEGRDSIIGQVVNRDYLFPDSSNIIRLGIHFDKRPDNWPLELSN